MNSLLQILTIIMVVNDVPIYGKPFNSTLETNSLNAILPNNVSEKGLINTTLSIKKPIRNNLLSDLARISQEAGVLQEETNNMLGNKTNKSPSSVTLTKSKQSLVHPTIDESATTRTSIMNSPSQQMNSYNANNYGNLIMSSEPMQDNLGTDNNNQYQKFSEVVRSNTYPFPENNGDTNRVKKTQQISPLITSRDIYVPSKTTTSGMSHTMLPEYTLRVNNNSPSNMGRNGIGSNAASYNTFKTENAGKNEYKEKSWATETNPSTQPINEPTSIEFEHTQAFGEDMSKEKDKSDLVTVCSGEKRTISCPADATLNIESASYGYNGDGRCASGTALPSCQASGINNVIQSACDGQSSCLLQSDGKQYRGECPGANNFLKVGYSCQYKRSSSPLPAIPAPPPAPPSPPPQSSSVPEAGYPTVESSPYIPHPVQPTTNNYNDNPPKYYNSYYRNYNQMQKPNPYTNYYNYNKKQDYNNYYKQLQKQQSIQPPVYRRKPDYKQRFTTQPSLTALPKQQTQQPHPPPSQIGKLLSRYYQPNSQYQTASSSRYLDYTKARPQDPTLLARNNNNYPANRGYYNQNYYSASPFGKYRQQSNYQYPQRNSYAASCYACQNCQQCNGQGYCQGCSKCKTLSCNAKPAKPKKYMDPIDTLVEEFGRKTTGMTPMEMSAVVFSPMPKARSSIFKSTPLTPPTEFIEEDEDNDSDEDEFEDITPKESDGASDDNDTDNNKRNDVKEHHHADSKKGVLSHAKKYREGKKGKKGKKKIEKRSKHWSPVMFTEGDNYDGVDSNRNTDHNPSKREAKGFSRLFTDNIFVDNGEEDSRNLWSEDTDGTSDDHELLEGNRGYENIFGYPQILY